MNKRTAGLLLLAVWVHVGCGPEVKIVEVDPPSISFSKPTQSQNIHAKALDIHDAEVSGVKFTYRSEDTTVATVDSDGTVKPAGNGSTAIVAEASTGKVTGESFVKVCLPKEIVCDPADKLMLKVGTSGPIKCHLTDCKDEKAPAKITFTPADTGMLLKEGDDIFIGLKVGDTSVKISAYGLEKTVPVRVDEQTYLPGMGPGSLTHGGGGGGGGGGKNKDPYAGQGGGRFDHILKNMNFGK
jgi:hypothetical protein